MYARNYSVDSYHVAHVAVIEKGVIKAKMSKYERVRHSTVDAYFDYTDHDNTDSCGSPIRFFTDPKS